MTTIRILVDGNPPNPRDLQTVGRMICWHDEYNLGDEHNYGRDGFLRELAFEGSDSLKSEVLYLEGVTYGQLYNRAFDADIDDPNEYARRLISGRVDRVLGSALSGCVILPLYTIDQYGISIYISQRQRRSSFAQVGWIVCDSKTVQREFNGDMEEAEKAIRTEVFVYDQYLTGDVYGFIVERDGKEDESCWGFFGWDVYENGMADYFLWRWRWRGRSDILSDNRLNPFEWFPLTTPHCVVYF